MVGRGRERLFFIVPHSPAHSVVVRGTGLAVMGDPQTKCDPGLVPLTKQGRVMALRAERVFFHLKGKTKFGFTLVWIGLFCL